MDTVDNRFLCRSGPVFYPQGLWVGPVDNQGVLWTAESCAHPVHRRPGVVPRSVPRNTQVLPRPTHHLGVTAFTLPWDRGHFVAEQWTKMWRSGPELCTTGPNLWAGGGQPVGGCCGRPVRPQSVDLGYPHIHTPLSSEDTATAGLPVESIWTTPVSPGCGQTKRRDPVDNRTAAQGIRTGRGARQLLMRLVSSVTWL